MAATGWPTLDALGGGLRRGHLSEIVGAALVGVGRRCSSALAAAATARGEVVALVDTHDRFDPVVGATPPASISSRLLWVRERAMPIAR